MSRSLTEALTAARELRELPWTEATDLRAVGSLVAAAGWAGRPLVNTALYSPCGFDGVAARNGVGRVERPPGRAVPSEAPAPADVGTEPGVIGADMVRRFRDDRCVAVDERSWSTPYAVATVVVGLCCAGVPVLTRALSAAVRSMVDPELLCVADEVTEQTVLEPGRREALSIEVRRRAHRVYGFHAPGDPRFPTVSVLVAAGPEQAPALLEQVAAQSWPQVQVHQVGVDADPHDVLHEVTEAGAIYVARMVPGIAYGPHHLEDLVQALRHSGAAWAASPPRFSHEPGAGVVLERPGLVIEDTSAKPARERTTAVSTGLALWYAGDGAVGPLAGPAYQNHGCSAVLLPIHPHRDQGPVQVVHRRHPPQLAWFRPGRHDPGPRTHRSYFARASSGVRS